MKAMSSRERMLTALRREEVDYVPCRVVFNPLSEVLRRGHEWNFPWSPDASLEEMLEFHVEHLGLDQVVSLDIDLCRPSPGVTSTVWLDGDILHKTYTTPNGDLHASVRYNDLWPCGHDIRLYSDFNIGHFVEPWIQNESDLASLKQIRKLCDTHEVLEEAGAAFAFAKKHAESYRLATICSAGMGLTGAMHLFGANELCMMTVENPGLVGDYLAYEHHINLRKLEVAGDLGVDIVNRNGFYETADFYSPDTLEQFIGQYLRRETDVARALGMFTSYTVNTGLMPILDYLASLTTDSLVGIDIAFKGMDLPKLRDKLAPTKSVWTGPSSVYHMWKGPEPTRQAVREVFNVFGKRGLILSPAVSTHSIMPWESTLAMIDEWKELR